MKVLSTDRAHQNEPNHTTFINARPNPAIKNALEVQKIRYFKTPTNIKKDLTKVITLHALSHVSLRSHII